MNLLYIDPGTGSMLFTLLLGLIGAVFYGVRVAVMKLRMKLVGKGKTDPNRVPFVFFSDNKRYWNVFRPVVLEMTGRGHKILYLTASEDDPAFTAGIEGLKAEFIGSGNKMFARLNNLNADIVLSTTPGLEVYQWKRAPKAKWYVHIPHAASEICLYRMFGIDYYDAILLSGKYQEEDIRALEALRKLPEKEIRMVGIPYMDEMVKKSSTVEVPPAEGKTVLLAPSWGDSAILAVYGGRIIDTLLDTGYHVIIRPHPQSFTADKETIDRLMEKYPETSRLHWNRDNNNFDVLARSDIMITDYSGIMYDFTLIFNKPVIYTEAGFKKDPYDCWCIEGETWMLGTIKKIGKELNSENIGQIKELIDSSIKMSKETTLIEEARNETWCNIGKSSELIADYLVDKLAELEKKNNPEKKEEKA